MDNIEYDNLVHKTMIEQRLEELDLKVPRGLEDLISAQGFKSSLPQIIQDTIDEKILLRSQLKGFV